jgi:hypothetical protein
MADENSSSSKADFCGQAEKDFAIKSPRKEKQKKIIDAQRKKIKRLQAKIKQLKSSKKRPVEALDKELEKLPKQLANFVKAQIKLHGIKKKGRRYSPELKSLAISIYHASGKAYKLLTKLFILPSKSSLRRYISKMPTSPGFSQGAINIIKSKVAQMDEKEKLVTLCMDEMSLKTHLYYDIAADKIVGLEDYGSGYRTNKVSTSGLVFLVRSITGGWKQPLGYALVNGACPREEMEMLMKEAIDKLEGIGLTVVVVISDMGSNFQSLANHLNITPENPWFIHNNQKYFVMFDPPHLLKCVRNNLMKYPFKFGMYTASWKDIEKFYNNDNTLTIRTAPKLTEKHLHPNGFSKMKVKYATQVFSHTVAAAICTYVSTEKLPPSASGTAELLSMFDSLFDCVNSSTIHSTKKMKCAMSNATSHQGFLKEAIKFIMSIEVLDGVNIVTGRIKCLKGWLVTLNAILQIWEHLKTMHDFHFLLTRRLNTDPIENFFGAIRQQGGNSDSPTTIQFCRAYRKLFFSSFLECSTGNCDRDLDTLLAEFSNDKPDTPVLVSPREQPNTLEIGATDYSDKNVGDGIKANATCYVAGYLLMKCLKRHACQMCKDKLVSNTFDDSRKLFCFFKAYETDKSAFGGLHAPSMSFFEFITKMEDVFVANFSVFSKSSYVGKHLLAKLENVAVSFQMCENFPIDYLRKLFLRMRIYYCLKFANRDFASPKSKRKNRKYIKVAHL